MSRATGDVRPVTVELIEESSWLWSYVTPHVEPWRRAAVESANTIAFFAALVLCALLTLYLCRLMLRRQRINGYLQ